MTKKTKAALISGLWRAKMRMAPHAGLLYIPLYVTPLP